MKNRIIWPALIGIWIMVICVVIEVTFLGNELMELFQDREMMERIDQILYRVAGVASVVSLLVYLILTGFAKKITKTLLLLTADAKNFKKGQYVHQIRDFEVEELQNLGYALDYMGEELSGTIRKLRYQNTKLESMFSALEEGIVVINTNGYIEETNALAKELLGIKEAFVAPCQITHLLRGEVFVNLVNEGLATNKTQVVELKLGERIVYITMVPVKKNQKVYEYLLLIKDVTRLRRLEEMKYQFVSNVSHEIKTPLTSIQGFVETLQAGAIEDKAVAYRFLNIIEVETKRLYDLIQDILLLSEVENMTPQVYGTVGVSEVINDTIILLQEQAKRKTVTIRFEEEERLKVASMKRDHLKQIIVNLVSNAIKYTDRGEIVITTWQEGEQKYIQIEDSGIGIPEESLPHIFERFYRVDKGRSRQSGGTGLGLSIVKHIARLYHIEIEVTSKVGEGTCFKLYFK